MNSIIEYIISVILIILSSVILLKSDPMLSCSTLQGPFGTFSGEPGSDGQATQGGAL